MLKKRFGQHFLRDSAVVDNIIAALQPQPTDVLLEIGGGDGALTGALAASGARLFAIEIDRHWAAHLTERYPLITIINADALQTDFAAIAGGGMRIVGNLPYNISTPLLMKFVRAAGEWRDCHLMVQKEIGLRLCAQVGEHDYGRLTVAVGLAATAEYLFEIPAAAFYPPPKVVSCFLRLRPRQDASPPSPAVDQVLRTAFQYRRKTLRNALATLPIDWRRCPIDGSRRPQSLSPAEFVTLAAHLAPDEPHPPISGKMLL